MWVGRSDLLSPYVFVALEPERSHYLIRMADDLKIGMEKVHLFKAKAWRNGQDIRIQERYLLLECYQQLPLTILEHGGKMSVRSKV
jgi:hypothetical protein